MGGTIPRDERSAMAWSVASSSLGAIRLAEAATESIEMITETTQSLQASFSTREGS